MSPLKADYFRQSRDRPRGQEHKKLFSPESNYLSPTSKEELEQEVMPSPVKFHESSQEV